MDTAASTLSERECIGIANLQLNSQNFAQELESVLQLQRLLVQEYSFSWFTKYTQLYFNHIETTAMLGV
jgi:hypothetical protein